MVKTIPYIGAAKNWGTVRTLTVSANRKCGFALSVTFGDSSPRVGAFGYCTLHVLAVHPVDAIFQEMRHNH